MPTPMPTATDSRTASRLSISRAGRIFTCAPASISSNTLRVAEPKPSKLDLFNAALAAADGPTGEATTAKKKKAPAKKADAAEAEAPAAEAPAAEAAAEPAAE